jgi:hypothetical protein
VRVQKVFKSRYDSVLAGRFMHLHERWLGDDAAYKGRPVHSESIDLMLNVIVINRWPNIVPSSCCLFVDDLMIKLQTSSGETDQPVATVALFMGAVVSSRQLPEGSSTSRLPRAKRAGQKQA